MTPSALLILKLCAAHATQVPMPYSNIVPTIQCTSSAASCLGLGTHSENYYIEYAPGFEDCERVVPPLEQQQQAEESAANAAKYKTEHAEEIAELAKALKQVRKEQPDLPAPPVVTKFPTCNSSKSCAITAPAELLLLHAANDSNTPTVHP